MTIEELEQRSKQSGFATAIMPGGGEIKVRKLTQAEVEYSGRHYASETSGLQGFRFMFAKCALNEDESPMFDTSSTTKLNAAMERVASFNFDDTKAVADAVMQFSGLMKAVDGKKN